MHKLRKMDRILCTFILSLVSCLLLIKSDRKNEKERVKHYQKYLQEILLLPAYSTVRKSEVSSNIDSSKCINSTSFIVTMPIHFSQFSVLNYLLNSRIILQTFHMYDWCCVYRNFRGFIRAFVVFMTCL